MSRPPRFTDAASRYQTCMELLAEEASRPPQSLATTHFVGSRRFVPRMEKRFGVDGPGRRVERRPSEQASSPPARASPTPGGAVDMRRRNRL